MKRIVYLSFYFKPDICAGSFRNSPLAIELAAQAKSKGYIIDIYTTLPNRYSTFNAEAPEFEEFDNLRINRISLPPHKSGMLDQVISFAKFYKEVIHLNKSKQTTLVFASSSRLFTAFLGFKIAKKSKALLYLDIRDIFVDTMNDVLKSKYLKLMVLPILKYIESKTFNYATHINLISGGFKEYFEKFENTNFTFFSNGIDDEFIQKKDNYIHSDTDLDIQIGKKLIVYAGNIGEGQGLHKIIPRASKKLAKYYQFIIVGDGGAKKQLQYEIEKLRLDNVTLKDPISRIELREIYKRADFLLLHLNDYAAFKKVLPSKIFELATYNKTILAGVSGYSAKFIKKEINNSFVFNPCDVDALVNFLLFEKQSQNINREKFINQFQRSKINIKMAASILNYI